MFRVWLQFGLPFVFLFACLEPVILDERSGTMPADAAPEPLDGAMEPVDAIAMDLSVVTTPLDSFQPAIDQGRDQDLVDATAEPELSEPLIHWGFNGSRRSSGRIDDVPVNFVGNSRHDAHGVSFGSGDGPETSGRAQFPDARVRVHPALMASGVFTIRVWINASIMEQAGPARIFTWSYTSGPRNLTIGQVDGNFTLRCRFSAEQHLSGGMLPNGDGGWQNPITTHDEPFRADEDTQLVARLNGEGALSLWVNETEYVPNDAARMGIEMLNADISSWFMDFGMGLGNEFGEVLFRPVPRPDGNEGDDMWFGPDGRPWLGRILGLSIYDEALTDEEIRASYRAGEP